MRLTAHEDGWIYGIFCAERHDDTAPAGDLSSATATAAIAAQGFEDLGAFAWI